MTSWVFRITRQIVMLLWHTDQSTRLASPSERPITHAGILNLAQYWRGLSRIDNIADDSAEIELATTRKAHFTNAPPQTASPKPLVAISWICGYRCVSDRMAGHSSPAVNFEPSINDCE